MFDLYHWWHHSYENVEREAYSSTFFFSCRTIAAQVFRKISKGKQEASCGAAILISIRGTTPHPVSNEKPQIENEYGDGREGKLDQVSHGKVVIFDSSDKTSLFSYHNILLTYVRDSICLTLLLSIYMHGGHRRDTKPPHGGGVNFGGWLDETTKMPRCDCPLRVNLCSFPR